MLKRYPSLQAMCAFLQAARVGSFSEAARQMNLTHSAISQQIRTLEDSLGQSLFSREASGVALTDAGRRLANTLGDGIAQIDSALLAAKNPAAAKTMTIGVDTELAQGWLNQRLTALIDQLPDYALTFLSTLPADRASLEQVNVSLCYGYGEWSDYEFTPICDDRVTAVASPEFVMRFGLTVPVSPAQVLTLPVLGYTRRSWRLWLDAAGLPAIEPQAVAAFDNVANLVAAAEAGVGVALTRGLLVADSLRQGRLVELTRHTIDTQYNLYAVWPKGSAERAAPLVARVRSLASDSLAGSTGSVSRPTDAGPAG